MRDVFIFDAVRTPRGKGKLGGGLSALAPFDLVARLVDALRERNAAQALNRLDRFVLSCVGQTGAQGGHLALVSRLRAELPDTVVAHTLNNFCVGGLTAVLDAASAIRAGDAELALAGGVECMSQVPFLADGSPYYADPATSRALRYAPVAVSADFMAHREGIERPALDAVTARSHVRAAEAWAQGRYAASVVAVRGPDGAIALDRDETVRPDTTTDALAKLPPAFAELGASGYDDVIRAARPGLGAIAHRHSIANCPPIADGAALVLLGTREAGVDLGLTPLARLVAGVEAAGDPIDQLTAGFAAMERVLIKAGASLAGLDVIEFMEAFAAVPVKFERDYPVDPARVNVNGGHLAMGHPMGATGAILLATLVHELVRRGGGRGLAVAHGGSGVGSAAVIERA